MIKPYFETELGKLYCGDCLKIMPELEPVDLVLTDPPYPDFNKEHGKNWKYTNLEIIKNINAQQFVFYPATRVFPYDHTSIHVWHKPNGQSNEHYEFIYERNGKKVHRVFRIPVINYKTLPEWTPHPTQKPLALINQLILLTKANMIYDPFLGSGTTAVSCEKLNRRWIGIEISEEYCEIAKQRIINETRQLKLFKS